MRKRLADPSTALFFYPRVRFNRKTREAMAKDMDKPSIDLLDLLISLYAEQEGVKITYELEEVAA